MSVVKASGRTEVKNTFKIGSSVLNVSGFNIQKIKSSQIGIENQEANLLHVH